MKVDGSVLPRIDETLHRLHPTGRYEDLALGMMDHHWAEEGPSHLLNQLIAVPGVSACLELAEFEMERRHVLHVGRQEAPTWQEFHRLFSDEDRREALQEGGGSIVYWNILLSRLGPFWTSYWNEFTEQGGRIAPELCTPPDSFEWKTVVVNVEELLRGEGLTRVNPELLDRPVRWLLVSPEHHSPVAGGAGNPSVYYALFEDLP